MHLRNYQSFPKSSLSIGILRQCWRAWNVNTFPSVGLNQHTLRYFDRLCGRCGSLPLANAHFRSVQTIVSVNFNLNCSRAKVSGWIWSHKTRSQSNEVSKQKNGWCSCDIGSFGTGYGQPSIHNGRHIIVNYYILGDMYAKCGSIDKACELFEQMHQRNVVAWMLWLQDMHKMHLVKMINKLSIKPDSQV